jgi:hypothetical protein
MAYTPTDGFQTVTTALMPVGSITMPLLAVGSLCASSSVSPAWVTIKSLSGLEWVKVTGCVAGVPNITATTIAHPSGACVQGFTLPVELIYAMLQSAGYIADCAPLTVVA